MDGKGRAGARVLTAALLVVALAGCGRSAPDPAPLAGATDPAAAAGATDYPAVAGGTDPPAAGATEPAPAAAPTLDPVAPFGRTTLTLATEDAEILMPAYVADEPTLRQQGLMGWEDLPEGAGMVFLFPDERPGPFWMRDTLLPLSIAYFAADGEILAILDMEPCTADPCPTYEAGVAYRGALEVEQGTFSELGVGVGARVLVPDDLWPGS